MKQLRGELEGLGYTVKLNDGEYALKKWILKREDTQDFIIEDENIDLIEI